MHGKEHILSLIRALQEMNLSNAKNVESLLAPQPKKPTPNETRRAQQFVLQQRFHLVNTLLHHLYNKAEHSVVTPPREPAQHALHSETMCQPIGADIAPTLTITTHDQPPAADRKTHHRIAAKIHRLTTLANAPGENKAEAKPTVPGTTPGKQTALLIHNKESFKEELVGLVVTSLKMSKKLNLDGDEIIAAALQQLLDEGEPDNPQQTFHS